MDTTTEKKEPEEAKPKVFSKKEKAAILRRIKNTKKATLKKYRLFEKILDKINIETEEKQYITTAAVDLDFNFYYSNSFIDSLSDEELEFIFMHELLHLVHDHVHHPDENYSHIENNIAMDLEINSVLKNLLKMPVPCGGNVLMPEKYSLPELMTFNWYLEHLPIVRLNNADMVALWKEMEAESNSGKDKNNGKQSGNLDKLSKEQREELKDALRKAKTEIEKYTQKELDSGDSLDGAKDLGDKRDEISKSHSFEGGALGQTKADTKFLSLSEILKVLTYRKNNKYGDYTYSKISNRYQGMKSPFIHPGKMKSYGNNKINCAIVVDISGSVHYLLPQVFSGLVETYKKINKKIEYDIDIYFTAEKVYNVVSFKEFAKLQKYPTGGGTNMFSGYEAACKSKKKYNDIVIITDAEDYSFSSFKKYNKKCYIAIPSKSDADYTVAKQSVVGVGNKNLVPLKLDI